MGRERPVQVWQPPLLAGGLQAGLRLSPRLRGTVCEAPPGQRGRAAGGSCRIMSAKDERAREILRGFKLYPPGSGAGSGGLGRRPLAEETGPGRGPRQVGTTRVEAGERKGKASRAPDGPGAGGGEGAVLREDRGVDWSPAGVEAKAPWNWAGKGAGRRERVSGRPAWVRAPARAQRPRRGCGSPGRAERARWVGLEAQE